MSPAAEISSGEPRQSSERSGRLEEAVNLVHAGLLCHAEKKLTALMQEQDDRSGMASLLLGRIYGDQGLYERAEESLLKTAEDTPVLKDYALKALTEIYIKSEDNEKVIATVQQISNVLLKRFAMQSEIASLVALQRHDTLREIYMAYLQQYPDDWQYKMDFALFLIGRSEADLAIAQYKDIYIGGGRLAGNALERLRDMQADTFSPAEKLMRADNLFAQYRYAEAEPAYKEVLPMLDGDEKQRVMFSIGMCQFRQKRYRASAGSFSHYVTPKWMYWHARSFYRMNNREGFDRVKSDFEKRFPSDRHLALLYLMEADELRRKGDLMLAGKGYEAVASRFPQSEEDALWGLGWMYYSAGKFARALDFFSRLAGFDRSKDYYKYLYWKARSQELLHNACASSAEGDYPASDRACGGGENFFEKLPSDRSYYGYMIKMRSRLHDVSERIFPAEPPLPDGEQYQRMHALAVMGMKEEALLEIYDAARKARSPDESLYLGYIAMKLDAYKEVISITEPKDGADFLPYSYPRAYWETIRDAAGTGGLDEHLVAALIREESRYDPDVVSWAGAVGLMQLLPTTAKRMNNKVEVHTGGSLDLSDARTNIVLGTHYLSLLVREFREIPFAVAAYNAGENRLRIWLDRYYRQDMAEFIENIPYNETRRYVKKVLKSYWQYRALSGLSIPGIEGQEPVDMEKESGLAKLTSD